MIWEKFSPLFFEASKASASSSPSKNTVVLLGRKKAADILHIEILNGYRESEECGMND